MKSGLSRKLEQLCIFNFSKDISDVKKVTISYETLHIRQILRSKNVEYVVLENWKHFLKR